MGSVSRGMRRKASVSAGGMGRAAASSSTESVQLGRLGQLAVPEEVGDLLEARLPRQLVDVVAAIGEAAIPPIEVAESGLGGDDALEPADERASFRHGWLSSVAATAD